MNFTKYKVFFKTKRSNSINIQEQNRYKYFNFDYYVMANMTRLVILTLYKVTLVIELSNPIVVFYTNMADCALYTT